jgi:hypothetical protein
MGIIAFFLVEKLTHKYLAHDHDHGSGHQHKTHQEADKGSKDGKKVGKATTSKNGEKTKNGVVAEADKDK